jgi:hypothetical protein
MGSMEDTIELSAAAARLGRRSYEAAVQKHGRDRVIEQLREYAKLGGRPRLNRDEAKQKEEEPSNA